MDQIIIVYVTVIKIRTEDEEQSFKDTDESLLKSNPFIWQIFIFSEGRDVSKMKKELRDIGYIFHPNQGGYISGIWALCYETWRFIGKKCIKMKWY